MKTPLEKYPLLTALSCMTPPSMILLNGHRNIWMPTCNQLIILLSSTQQIRLNFLPSWSAPVYAVWAGSCMIVAGVLSYFLMVTENLKTPVMARTLHLPKPYDSRPTPHPAMQPRIVKFYLPPHRAVQK
jgi:hypothetical protein